MLFFACMGHFWKIPCPSKTFFLPICLLCAFKGIKRVFPFFLWPAALCIVLLRQFKILPGACSKGTLHYLIQATACSRDFEPSHFYLIHYFSYLIKNTVMLIWFITNFYFRSITILIWSQNAVMLIPSITNLIWFTFCTPLC